jgi:hypothetical protein
VPNQQTAVQHNIEPLLLLLLLLPGVKQGATEG